MVGGTLILVAVLIIMIFYKGETMVGSITPFIEVVISMHTNFLTKKSILSHIIEDPYCVLPHTPIFGCLTGFSKGESFYVFLIYQECHRLNITNL